MIAIGGKPIIWHIMKSYSQHGFNEFVILLGYKGYVIKEYFSNYFLHQSDVTFDLSNNSVQIHDNSSEPWKVTLLDTGLDTMTGGRLSRARPYLDSAPFMLTYGDGVSDINISELLDFHRNHSGIMTVTSVQPEGRFGALDADISGRVRLFEEKPIGDGGWINAGYFVCNPELFDYIPLGDSIVFEKDPMHNLVESKQLFTYHHKGFWQCMDTLRDKMQLETMWQQGKARWRTW
jgi:glucose-1-phosphate cytidylyltransferase